MNTQNLMWYRRAMMLLALLVFAGSTAFARVPDAPAELFAGWSPDGQGGRVIDVVWMDGKRGHGHEDDVDGYYLYQSINSGAFSRVATVAADPQQWGGYTQLTVSEPGLYTFYVTAYNDDGESEASNEAEVEISSAWIAFAGENPKWDVVEPGVEYTYTFTATASNGADIRYAAGPGTDHWGNEVAATIDEVTGEFRTTVDEEGYYNFPVVAYLADDTTVYAMTMLSLQVGDGHVEPKFCAVIKGSITDDEGNAVERGVVTAFPADDQPHHFAMSAQVENGAYEIPVMEGSYYLVFEGEYGRGHGHGRGYFLFYPGTENFEEATAVTVACDDTIAADFTVEHIDDTTVTITVSGRVTRASDNSGVMAEVVFFDNNTWNCTSTSVMTDEDGYYEIELPVQEGPWNYAYIAMAMPYESGLFYEYFNETINPEEATVITESRSDVNFTLGGLAVYDNSISGMITDEENNPVDATVLAFPAGDVTAVPTFGVVDTEEGAYTMQNLAPGTYYLVVLPHKFDGMPGYYAGAGQTVTMSWEEAVTVEIDSTSNLAGIDMIVPKVDAEGINVVEGQISAVEGSIGKGDDVLGAQPLAGVMIYALDQNGTVVGSTTSAQDGTFTLSGLGVGSYRIYADKIGFAAYESTVSFDKPASKHTVDVALQPNAATDVEEPILENVGFSTFPNPVTSQLSVRFTSLAGTVTLSVNDVTGKALITRDVQTLNGENTVQLDLGALPAGMYMVTLKAENSVLAAPVTVVR